MPQGQGQHIHAAGGDPAYGPPVLRPPSPASSVGTKYGPDGTSPEDAALSPQAFAQHREEKIGLGRPRDDEVMANLTPLLHPRPKTEAEEKALHERIMRNLRQRVRELQENEIFEQTLLRGSQAALEPQPTSNDIDAIMRSMMGPPPASTPRVNGTNAALRGTGVGRRGRS